MIQPAKKFYHKLYRRYARWSEVRAAEAMIVSFPKSGRTWVRYMLGLIVERLGGCRVKFDNLLDPSLSDFPKVLFTHSGSDRYVKASVIVGASDYPDKRVVLLARDPRDVVVSYFFELTKRTPIYRGSLNDFLFDGEFGLPQIIDFMNDWVRAGEVRESFMMIRYEDLKTDTLSEMRQLLRFLSKMEIDDGVLAQAIRDSSFNSMRHLEEAERFGPRLRPRDPSDLESFKTRKGKIGGYVDYLLPHQIQTMNELIKSRLDPRFNY